MDNVIVLDERRGNPSREPGDEEDALVERAFRFILKELRKPEPELTYSRRRLAKGVLRRAILYLR